MRPPGPPVRFLIAVLGIWVVGRTALLVGTGGAPRTVATIPPAAPVPPLVACPSCRRGLASIAPPATGLVREERRALQPAPGARVKVDERISSASRRTVAGTDLAYAPAPNPTGQAATPLPANIPRSEPPAGLAGPRLPVLVAATGPPAASRWSGSAWLFARGRGGASLAGGGQLGGSQAGGRIAYRVDTRGRLALAARAYAPLDHPRGGEVAVGVDVHPLPSLPFRLSAERRIAVGRDGRDAWSAYAAGGFFRGLGRTLELDGYGQAGIVGLRARDLFADGAVRIARRVSLGTRADLLVGAGAWGAAQPGAARLDLGPHAALRVPAGGTSIGIAADWRLRVAGDARPGSGPTLTVAADF